jgi:4-amino-4-deoxy-L-arabinose transferase-like glycosyltransferase
VAFSISALSPRWAARVGLAVVALLFCVPLFFGLDGWDQRNDEAIYSYAVDRILETGDWLTPRAIPDDGPFLEKPPLKFWAVAAPMKAGLLPVNDAGMRAVDAIFGALSFVYVYALARRLSGPLAGIVSVFVLFEFEPLLLNHGLRGNHMEAPLLLAYCGGLYHFVRWADTERRDGRRHALAAAGYFVLAFMTKFVAAAFLPIICVSAMAVRPSAWPAWRARWRDWLAPFAVAIAAIAPWFIYQTLHSGMEVWRVMLAQHVVSRFAGTLHATHVQPWHHYFTMIWQEFGYSQSRTIVVCGMVALGLRASRPDGWLARLLWLWWIVPFALMSLGTAKVFHYAYPFLPPLAIGAGLLAAWIVDAISGHGRTWLVNRGVTSLGAGEEARRRAARWSPVLQIVGALCLAMAAWTLMVGPVSLEAGGVRIFRNSSIVRPLVLGAVCWHVAGLSSVSLRIAGLYAIALLLPLSMYGRRVDRLRSIDHPLRTARDCALDVQASTAGIAKGVFNASADVHHGFYYYLHRLGPWLDRDAARPDELQRRLENPGEQTPVMLSADDYVRLGGHLTPGRSESPRPPAVAGPGAIPLARGVPPGIAIGDVVVILFPGPFARCAAPAALAGATELKPVAGGRP